MDLILLSIVVFISALIQGLSGFGGALIAMSILPIFMPLEFLIPLIAINSLFINLLNFNKAKSNFNLSRLLPLLAGSIIGVPLGIYCLENINPTVIKKTMGGVLICYALFSLTKKRDS